MMYLFLMILIIQNLGINAADINKLKIAGKISILLLNNKIRILYCSFDHYDNKKRLIEC